MLLALLHSQASPILPLFAHLGVDSADVESALACWFPAPGGSRIDAEALARLGIDFDVVRAQLEQTFGPGALERSSASCLGIAPRLKLALAYALDYAADRPLRDADVLVGMLILVPEPAGDLDHLRPDETVEFMHPAFGGAFVRVRAELGLSAFGVQVIELPPDSGELAPEHDHTSDGQEELYLLLDGSAELALPDRTLPLERETFVRIGPETRRRVRSGPEGARLLMVGGVPGKAYEPTPLSELGGPEQLAPGASTAMNPAGPPPQLTT